MKIQTMPTDTQAAVPHELSILVVDDELFVRTLTVHTLQQLGFQHIETASDGEDALRIMLATTPPFELVICDLNMPVMDGFDFMRGTQQISYKGGLIVLSSEESQVLTAAAELGKSCGLAMLGALTKPLEQEQLRALLHGYDPSLR